MLQENCYVVSDETNEAVVIDCGAYFEDERQAIVNYINREGLTVKHLLCTHGHFDHCFGNYTIWQAFGTKPEVAAEDEWLMDIGAQMRTMMGSDYGQQSAPLGEFMKADAVICFGNHSLRVLPTPGHTPGGVCFYCEAEKVVFTGDTLFRMSVGRTDFERSSWQQLNESLRGVLALLPADTRVYPGHGPQTLIGEERQMNPYLR
jgi:glyoxylase-like metal-dependent hydrolase (beta-lactamase superfamily II)